MTNPTIITARQMREYVQNKRDFTNRHESCYARWAHVGYETHAALYVVYSYGSHFPMYVWDSAVEQWFANRSTYSRTTNRHQANCDPQSLHNEIPATHWFDTEQLRDMIYCGGLTRWLIWRENGMSNWHRKSDVTGATHGQPSSLAGLI